MNKKIRILLFVITLSQANNLFGQKGYLYDDANTLINDSKTKDRLSILAFYANKASLSTKEADSILNVNPFLCKALGSKGGYFFSQSDTLKGIPAEGDATSVGSFDVTNIANGIAKFMIKRGKQELSTAFFNSFKKDLAKYPELTVLFPRASIIIQNIDSYDILTVMQQLQDAFKKDILNLPTNILSFRSINTSVCGKDTVCIKRIESIADAFNSPKSIDFIIPLLTVQGIINGSNIIDIANNIAADTSLNKSTDDFIGYIKLTSILFESLRNSNEKGVFVQLSDIKSMFRNQHIRICTNFNA